MAYRVNIIALFFLVPSTLLNVIHTFNGLGLGGYGDPNSSGLSRGSFVGTGGGLEMTADEMTATLYGCFCVPLQMCTDNDVAVNGAGLLDLRKEQAACKNYFEVCCDYPLTTAEGMSPPQPQPPPMTMGQYYPPVPVAVIPATMPDMTLPHPLPIPLPQPFIPGSVQNNHHAAELSPPLYQLQQRCGIVPLMSAANTEVNAPLYRITGITDDSNAHAQFGELPWTVVILYKQSAASTRSLYKCGGSLINEKVVMTAAHCITNPRGHWTIRAGEWNTNSEDEPFSHQDRFVDEIIVHPSFQASSLKNDIALLILAEPVLLGNHIGTVCLPVSNPDALYHSFQQIGVNANQYYADQQKEQIEGYTGGQMRDKIPRCIASGWGKNAFKRGRHSAVLRKVELPLVDRESCVTTLRTTRLGKFYQLHGSFICAGGEADRDTCKGDGGSPLVCPGSPPSGSNERRYVQVGIVSWGIGCGEDRTPGVYVNVALFRDWIDEQLLQRKIAIDSY